MRIAATMNGLAVLLMLGAASPLFAQISGPPGALVFVTADPAGSCANSQAMQYNPLTGSLWGCKTGTWNTVGGAGGSTVPGGSGTALQYRSGSSFGGSSYLSTNETTKVLTLGGNVTVGNVAVPVAPVIALAGAGAGNLPNLQLSYVQTWLTASGESAPSALSNNVTIADHTVNGKMTVTLDTAGPAGSTGKNLYRSVVTAAVNNSGCPGNGIDNCEWKKVNSSPIAVATASFTDNVADGSLGAVVHGWDTTAGVIADTFGQVLARDAFGNDYLSSIVFLSPGYDSQGRYFAAAPDSASAGMSGGGVSGGLGITAVGNNGTATEFHYLAFGADTTHPLVGITACYTDLNGCGSPGSGSATPVTLLAINSDFGADQFRLDSTGNVSDSTIGYSLGLNESGTPLGVIEAANLSNTVAKPNFVARAVASQTVDLLQALASDGSTVLSRITKGGASAGAVNTVSFSATPTFDASLGNSQKITLTGNVTSSTLSNLVAGEGMNFQVCQDGSGSHTFVWPTNVKGPVTIGSTASKCSMQSFMSFDGSNLYATSAGVTNQ